MAFKFASLCDLLEELEDNRLRKVLPTSRGANPDLRTITTWFNQHTSKISRSGPSAIAFLSCLFPERRVDRVYGLRERKLTKTLARCLCLGVQRRLQFERSVLDGDDIGQCAQRVLREAEFPQATLTNYVTLEEIDEALDRIGAGCRYSASELRQRVPHSRPDEALEPIYRRLQSREAKWLTRIILKNLSPIVLPEVIVMNQYHFLLYDLLSFQDSFAAAVSTLQDQDIIKLSPRQPGEHVEVIKREISHRFCPRLNTFIRRQPYDKARSIKHCCQLSRRKQMSVERKYDGEYCQVHVDIAGIPKIRLFSKSGKDSTSDREKINGSLARSLRLGETDCKIQSRCILEGELLVYNDLFKHIQPFRTIRKHVNRSGRFLGTEQDSAAHPNDHLMLMLYDVLLWDDVICVKEPHHQRRGVLKGLVTAIPGRIEIVRRETIDFRSSRATAKLRTLFAQSITQRWEGLVLKGMDDPYSVSSFNAHGIKLKKDYIQGLGDTEDFVILGGRFSRQEFLELENAGIRGALNQARLRELWWTTLHIGCLENKSEVLRWDARPSFRVVGTAGIHCVAKEDLVLINQLGQFRQMRIPEDEKLECFDITFDQVQMPLMTTAFSDPFVVEVMGAGFDRPAGVSYPMLRFPRIQKIHDDRTIKDTISLDELRDKAREAEAVPLDNDSQEDAQWIERLICADGRSPYVNHSQATTPGKDSTAMAVATPSLTKSTPLFRIDSPNFTPLKLISPNAEPTVQHELATSQKRNNTADQQENPSLPKRSLKSAQAVQFVEIDQAAKLHKRPAIRPLAEITNLSAARTVKASNHLKEAMSDQTSVLPSKPMNLETAEPVPPPGLQSEINKEMTGTRRLDGQMTNLPSLALPTPPGTALEEIDNPQHDDTAYLPSLPGAAASTAEQGTEGSAQPKEQTLSTVLAALHRSLQDCPALLGFNVDHQGTREELLLILKAAQMSFTFSRAQFLRACLRFVAMPADWTGPDSRGILHLVLLDQASMSAAAISSMSTSIGRSLSKHVKEAMGKQPTDAVVQKHALVFLDFRIVDLLRRHPLPGGRARQAREGLSRHFWGAFLWPLNRHGQVGATWRLRRVAEWLSD